MNDAIIIGAGITGLSAGLALHKRGMEFQILEEQDHIGGVIQTLSRDGYLMESGPNTLQLSDPDVRKILEEHQLLAGACEASPDAQHRFVVQNGHLMPLPLTPTEFIKSPLISWQGKIRAALEFLIPRGRIREETLATFFRRRLGKEILDELAGPFVSGIFAGDPEKLLARHAMPRLHRLEQQHGSLLRSGLRRKGIEPRGKLVSWPGGLTDFVQQLAEPIRSRIHCRREMTSYRWDGEGWVIHAVGEEFRSKNLLIATDAVTAAELMARLDSGLEVMHEIPHAAMTVVHLGYRRERVGHLLNGFGALISRKRGIRTLGVLFSSSLFPGRAPEGKVLLTAFIGGRMDPEAIHMKDDDVVAQVVKDLTPLLELKGAPDFIHIVRWPRAIPQYESGYEEALAAMERVEAKVPGLHLIGNYRHGISIPDCIRNGYRAGMKITPLK